MNQHLNGKLSCAKLIAHVFLLVGDRVSCAINLLIVAHIRY